MKYLVVRYLNKTYIYKIEFDDKILSHLEELDKELSIVRKDFIEPSYLVNEIKNIIYDDNPFIDLTNLIRFYDTLKNKRRNITLDEIFIDFKKVNSYRKYNQKIEEELERLNYNDIYLNQKEKQLDFNNIFKTLFTKININLLGFLDNYESYPIISKIAKRNEILYEYNLLSDIKFNENLDITKVEILANEWYDLNSSYTFKLLKKIKRNKK